MLIAFEAATDKSSRNLEMNHLIPTTNRRTGVHFLPVCTPHTDVPPRDNVGSFHTVQSRALVLVCSGIPILIPKKEKQYQIEQQIPYLALELGSDVRSTRRCLPEYSHCTLIVPLLAHGLPIMSTVLRHWQRAQECQLSLPMPDQVPKESS